MSNNVYLNFVNKICTKTCNHKEIIDCYGDVKFDDNEFLFDCINDEIKLLKYSLDKFLMENELIMI